MTDEFELPESLRHPLLETFELREDNMDEFIAGVHGLFGKGNQNTSLDPYYPRGQIFFDEYLRYDSQRGDWSRVDWSPQPYKFGGIEKITEKKRFHKPRAIGFNLSRFYALNKRLKFGGWQEEYLLEHQIKFAFVSGNGLYLSYPPGDFAIPLDLEDENAEGRIIPPSKTDIYLERREMFWLKRKGFDPFNPETGYPQWREENKT
jgi:hypothetical protein